MQRQRWLHPVDEQLLGTLAGEGVEYAPVLAATIGVAPTFADQRVERLVEQGLAERVTPEPVYRVTAAGHEVLEESADTGVPLRSD